MLRPIAQTGNDPVYSMGDDAALAPLAGRARTLASYLRQRFAQVTNPAIDHYRERAMMSVSTLLGPRAPLDAEGPVERLIVLPSFLASSTGLDALDPARVDASFDESEFLAAAVERVADACVGLVEEGAQLVCISDRAAGGVRAPIPSLLALSAAHQRLVERGLRTRCSLLVESDEPRDTHMVAALVGYGADVVCPRLALQTVAQLAATDKVGGDRPDPAEAQRRLLRALEDGVLKVMSKMGISDVASYRGARLFEAVGLDRKLCRRFLGGTPSGVGGIGLDRLEREALERLATSAAERPELENPGFYKFRKGGEPHATTPEVVEALQASVAEAHALRAAVRGERTDLYERFADAGQRPRPDRAARPARAVAGARARAARRGRAGRGDPAPLLRWRDVAWRTLGRGSRDDRGRAQPDRRPLQLRRRGRGSGALSHAPQFRNQADRLGAASASPPSTRPTPRSCRSRSRRARSPARVARSLPTR